MSTAKENKTDSGKASTLLIRVGACFVGFALLLFGFIFYKVIWNEFSYFVNKIQNSTAVVLDNASEATLSAVPKDKQLIPVDLEFGVVIPKIRANAKVIADVNPFNSYEYQLALTKGVAHARGSVYPGFEGNIFLFAHSSGNFYDANRYNSIFYLLNKIEVNDEILIYYKNEKYVYKVTTTKIVNADEVAYLKGQGSKKTVTLMTCWPAGTTAKRLLIIAEQQ